MSFLDSFTNGIRGHFNRKSEQQKMLDNLRSDADRERLVVFEQEFKKNAKEVAIAQAKKEAAELSGLQKLRATNRARNLSSNEQIPGSFFEKLGDFTRKNKTRMQENLKRTAEMRKVAEEEKNKKFAGRMSNSSSQKSFGRPNWKM